MPRLRILVLAAGFSKRLGKPKALARIAGVSLLRRTACLLAPLADSALVVVAPPRCSRYRAELRGLDVRLVENWRRAAGLASSLRRGLSETRRSSATLIVPVDLAGLRRRDLERLVARWRASRRRLAARRIGRRGGVPLILPRWRFAAAAQIHGDTGLREFVAALGRDQCVLVDMPSAVQDVDTGPDLRLARRRMIAAATPCGRSTRRKPAAPSRYPRA